MKRFLGLTTFVMDEGEEGGNMGGKNDEGEVKRRLQEVDTS